MKDKLTGYVSGISDSLFFGIIKTDSTDFELEYPISNLNSNQIKLLELGRMFDYYPNGDLVFWDLPQLTEDQIKNAYDKADDLFKSLNFI
jgi:hypothetical protein